MSEDLSNGRGRSALGLCGNERNLKIYVLGCDTFALVGRDESWEIGIVVRLAHAFDAPLIWGKRPLDLASAERPKSPRRRCPASATRFYYLGPDMRRAVQLDVSLVLRRRTTRSRLRASSSAGRAQSDCEKFRLPSRLLRGDNIHRRRKITLSPRESRDDDNGDDGTSSSAAVQAGISLSLSGSPPVVPFINTLERGKERDERCANTEANNVCTTSSTIAAKLLAPRLPAPAVSTLSNVVAAADNADGNDTEGGTFELASDANVAQTNAWLRARRFQQFQATFASFSAGDILRLSRDDLIQICGLADGIRLFNALHSKAPTPKLTLYFAIEGNASMPWRVIYLENLNSALFASKLLATLNLPHDRLQSVLIQGPQGVHVLVSNELVANIKDESMYLVEIIKDCSSERYKLLLKPSISPTSSKQQQMPPQQQQQQQQQQQPPPR